MALLEVKDLHYYYGNVHALKGVSLEVNEGEIVTLIGSNGAGKTTLLQTLSGLTSPKGVRGQVFFDGKDITCMKGHKITGMGMAQVLEGRHIFPKLTVRENITMGAYLRKDKEEITRHMDQMLELFPRLREREHALGGTLSGEHGIGRGKIKYLAQAAGDTNIALMQGIKAVFDPKMILNPGKIFPMP